MEWTNGNYLISTDRDLIDVEVVHRYLNAESYWAAGIPLHVAIRSIEHSLCFGLYKGGRQTGFARVITDYATFGYLADVFVLEPHRGHGLSKWMLSVIRNHPDLQGFRRWMLATRDAHGLYAQFGFTPLSSPDRLMELLNPDVYGALE
jgi:GNAT superfamily N-acetyltransferase